MWANATMARLHRGAEEAWPQNSQVTLETEVDITDSSIQQQSLGAVEVSSSTTGRRFLKFLRRLSSLAKLLWKNQCKKDGASGPTQGSDYLAAE